MPSWVEPWLPVLSAFLGAAAAFGGVWVAQHQQDRRERATREHERKVAVITRREEFELQHLVEFNALLREVQVTRRAWRRTHTHVLGEPVPDFLGRAPEQKEAAEAHRAAVAAMDAQIGFILSDDVRTLAEGVREIIANEHDQDRFENSAAFTRELNEAARRTYEALSARVREIYASREAS